MTEINHDEIEKIKELKAEGFSNREIARKLWGSSGFESRIRRMNLTPPRSTDKMGPRILILDVESSPEVSMHWRRFKENISEDQNMLHTKILGFCYKWLGETEVHSVYPSAFLRYLDNSDEEYDVICKAREVLDQADIVVTHNGIRFDIPLLQARMLYWGIDRPSPFRQVDTLQIAKKEFRFPQNKLDVIGRYLGLGQKVEHEGFMLWRKCMEGDPDAWLRMQEYNVGDVVLQEEVYLALAPWAKNHPNVSLHYPNGVERCPVCASHNIERTEGFAYTNVSVFDLYRCNDCGTYARGRRNIKTADQRKNILTTVR